MESFYGYAGSSDRRTGPWLSFHYAPSTYLRPVSTRRVYCVQFKQTTMQAKFQILALKNAYRVFITACSLPKGHCGGTLQLAIDEFPSQVHPIHLNIQSTADQIESEKFSTNTNEEHQILHIDVDLTDEAESASNSGQITTDIRESEMQRRRKIGLANKGRIPWNKGRKHSEETRERISKRTIEALSDPKIRKKMSESPRSHSAQSKVRISSSLRKIWEERLRRRRLQEKCYLTWARSIAEAAKEGSSGQEELEWDAYEREKSDINSQHLQWKADKARAKEIAKLRAEKDAKIWAENAARRAQLRKEKEEKAVLRERKEKEEKAVIREMKALARKKSEELKMKMALLKGLKCKSKLTKLHHHKRNLQSSTSIQREIEVEPQPIVDNLDIDLIKIEKMRRRISLAEQIQAVKNRKGELNLNNFLASTYPISSSEVEAGDL